MTDVPESQKSSEHFCTTDCYLKNVTNVQNCVISQNNFFNTNKLNENALSYKEHASETENISLSKVGILYKSQFGANLTPTKKVFLSFLNGLCRSKFAREHGDSINLNDAELAKYSEGRFSSRQIKRHLEDLNATGFIVCSYRGGERWIEVQKEPSEKFMPVIDATSDQNSLTASQILILSKLFDRASFYFKAEMGFAVDQAQMIKLETELFPLCVRSIRLGLQKLKDSGLIFYISDLRGAFQPVTICEELCKQYREMFNLKPSKTCRDLVQKQAVEKVLRSAPDAVVSTQVKEKRDKKERRRKGFAEVGAARAKTAEDTKQGRQRAWQHQVSEVLRAPAEPSQKYLELTSEQTFKLIFCLPAKSALSVKKGKSHRSCRQIKAFPTSFVGKNGQTPSLYINRHSYKGHKSSYTDLSVDLNSNPDFNLLSINL